jgi:hypothetical protein
MVKYSLETNQWTQIPTSGQPQGLFGTFIENSPLARYVRYKVSLTLTTPFNKMYIFDTVTLTWALGWDLGQPNTTFVGVADPSVAPAYTYFPGLAVTHKARLFLHGSFIPSFYSNSLFTYDVICPGQVINEYADCTDCNKGFYANETCQPCPIGTSTIPPLRSCQSCPAGTFGAAGSTGEGVCFPCAAGMFNNRSGQLLCSACPSGFTSQSGASNCSLLCPPGYFANSTTNGLCSPCPIGSVPKDGGVGCQVCPAGTTTISAGDARCSPCTDELNLFSNASTYGVCSTCASGAISSPDKGSCVPCPAGTFHLAPHVPLCVPCPAGNFSTAGVTACSQCPPNTFSNEDTKGNCESCTPPLVPTRSQNGCIFVPPPPVASVAAAPENGSSTVGGNDASSLASSSSNFVTIAAALCLSFVIFL